ncbi:Aldo/keto reductase [Mycena capillaripes]|nr:Aldo/keto reductase [Mycena capillaripes]KAJ6533239.1 Aldo/keto reductase [Mycena capillaripes]
MSVPTVKLNSGYEIPIIGLGTSTVHLGVCSSIFEISRKWLKNPDSYGNEKDVGAGIAASGVPRSEIFITSKVWGTWHSRVEECLDQSLANLGTDYLDLYLVHWPVPMNPNGNHPFFPLSPMESARSTIRKVRTIGVSNFSEMNLEKILPTAEIVPAVDQLELHVYNPQHKLLAYLRSKGIHPQAYSPLGSTGSPLFKDETVVEIATKHGLQPADVLIGYLVAKDIITLPKSVTPSRIASNVNGGLAALAKLQPADLEALDGLAAAGKQKRFIMPPWPVDLGFENWG